MSWIWPFLAISLSMPLVTTFIWINAAALPAPIQQWIAWKYHSVIFTLHKSLQWHSFSYIPPTSISGKKENKLSLCLNFLFFRRQRHNHFSLLLGFLLLILFLTPWGYQRVFQNKDSFLLQRNSGEFLRIIKCAYHQKWGEIEEVLWKVPALCSPIFHKSIWLITGVKRGAFIFTAIMISMPGIQMENIQGQQIL